jgi:hypothetical protein
MQHPRIASKKLLPALFPILALLLGTIVGTRTSLIPQEKEATSNPQKVTAQSTVNEDDIIYCDQALNQQQDELAMLSEQQDSKQNPCLFMNCAGLF